MHLLREVEKLLNRSQTAPTRFGRDVVGDPRFVFDLRRGREPRQATVERVRAFLENRPLTRLPMSKAGAALLRGLLARALVHHDRILLTEYCSTDWQSLTFIGERHEMRFRIPGPGAEGIFAQMTGDLTDEEFAIPKQIVADVVVYGAPARERDGSISIEALTIEE